MLTILDSDRGPPRESEDRNTLNYASLFLKKKGVWKKINEIPEEELESQLEELAVDRIESAINLNNIVEMFDVDRQTVRSKRNADFRISRDAILQRKIKKGS